MTWRCRAGVETLSDPVAVVAAQRFDGAPVREPAPVTGETSDGYHTFNELYEHRFVLWMALCRVAGGAWRARLHSDGTSYPGWFVLGLGTAKGEQITYHLPESKWGETDFAETFDRVRDFDGHTSPEVVQRIREQFVLGPMPSMSARSENHSDNPTVTVDCDAQCPFEDHGCIAAGHHVPGCLCGSPW